MRYAIVRNWVVEQIILWDGAGGWTPPAGTQAIQCEDTTAIGDLYGGKQFAKPVIVAKPASETIEVVGPDNLTDSERATFKALAAKVAG